jgi:hypothetical protein
MRRQQRPHHLCSRRQIPRSLTLHTRAWELRVAVWLACWKSPRAAGGVAVNSELHAALVNHFLSRTCIYLFVHCIAYHCFRRQFLDNCLLGMCGITFIHFLVAIKRFIMFVVLFVCLFVCLLACLLVSTNAYGPFGPLCPGPRVGASHVSVRQAGPASQPGGRVCRAGGRVGLRCI